MVLEAENRFLLASASCLVCKEGSSALASCAPLVWTRPDPYSGIFTMPPERNFPFHFFQSWQEESSACLIQFSASFLHTCQGHGLNICVVLRGRCLSSAPRHCQQHCIAVFPQQQFSIFLQDHTVLCSFLPMGRHLSRGSWPGLGSCWEQPPAVSVTWASPCHCCNECV